MSWALFADLESTDIDRVLAAAQRRKFKKRETLFHQGDPGDSVFLLEKGHVAVRVTTSWGQDMTCEVLGPGQFFGELSIFTPRHRRTAAVVALDDVETLALTGTTLEELRHRHPEIGTSITIGLARRVDQLSTALIEALYIPVEQRVVRRVLDLARLYGDGQGPVVIPLTQDDVAGLAGATRPTVNQVLNKFAERGALELSRGRIVVLDPAPLVSRARAEPAG